MPAGFSLARCAAPILVAVIALLVPLSAGEQAGQLLGTLPPTFRPFPGDQIFQTTKLHKIHITIDPGEWAVLQTSTPRGGTAGGALGGSEYRDAQGRLIHVGSGFGGYFPWARADVRIEGGGPALQFRDAGLRYKGNLTFSTSSASAPLFANFKLKFDVHGGKGKWDGEKTFNLHPGVVDTSKMREAVAYAVFRAAGVPAPRTAYAEIFFTVPGNFPSTSGGLFTIIEDVNKTFLERVLPPGNGLLMKPEGLRGGVRSLGDAWTQYAPTLRPDRDATPHEQQRVIEFSKLVSQTDVKVFRARIGEYLDVDQFLRFIAVHGFLVNTDSYLRGGHNFYLYLDPSDGKFRFLPWDQDLSMGSRGRMGGESFDIMNPANTDQPLIYWLLDDPSVAARYKAIVHEIADKVFLSGDVLKLVDALQVIGSGRGASPRAFLETRINYIRTLR
jgi:spore coat protein H